MCGTCNQRKANVCMSAIIEPQCPYSYSRVHRGPGGGLSFPRRLHHQSWFLLHLPHTESQYCRSRWRLMLVCGWAGVLPHMRIIRHIRGHQTHHARDVLMTTSLQCHNPKNWCQPRRSKQNHDVHSCIQGNRSTNVPF